MNNVTSDPTPVVFVTGPSGAGRSTAIAALEDLSYEVIDNLPLSLVGRVLNGPPTGRPLALGIDTRNRDFSVQRFADLIAKLRANPAVGLNVLYVDCASEILLRRYSETRRRHPAADGQDTEAGIAQEILLLQPLKEQADHVIDTSNFNIHELRGEVDRIFAVADVTKLAVSVQSFSYKRGLPLGLDLAFDVRFLRNPHWAPELREKTGQSEEVAAYIAKDTHYLPFRAKVEDLLLMLLPAYEAEGKSHLTIGLGCTGGQHRSVAVAESLAVTLAESGWRVSVRHRELERRSGQTWRPGKR
ncbi:MAG: RNase adapter RapZ [Yoonia sp.]